MGCLLAFFLFGGDWFLLGVDFYEGIAMFYVVDASESWRRVQRVEIPIFS
jgi:hypothetical protein